jgi:hypothetical protein
MSTGKLSMVTSTWTFDGFFQTQSVTLELDNDNTSTKPFNITKLKFFPIKYADPLLTAQLRKEGETFWDCRKRCYVCYSEDKHIPGENNVCIQPIFGQFVELFMLIVNITRATRDS